MNMRNSARAFSLTELLVVIVVIGVLIAIAIPALIGARASARQSVCLSNLRGLGGMIENYAGAYRSMYPFAPEGTPLPILPPEDGGAFLTAGHWNLRVSWPALMHDVAPWPEHFRAWLCPGAARDRQRPWIREGVGFGAPSYQYSTSFIARPQTWTPDVIADPGLLLPVGTHEVSHPAAKVVMIDSELAHGTPAETADERDPRPLLFADGHCKVLLLSKASPPAVNPFTATSWPLHDTASGCRGIDY